MDLNSVDLSNKKIILGITGSIAAYKSPFIIRQLVKAGAEVKVIMTPAATDFVSKLTLSTLSKSPVLIDLFEEGNWANHALLGRWADAILIAPLSCNTLSKMATGQCDHLLLAVYLSATCPVIVAPAMDEDMWKHPATRENINKISEHKCSVVNVNYGELASGLTGEGRMAEPEAIVEYLKDVFSDAEQLKGRTALVTAGPTYEPIDPVRFIGNHSSGKMGIAIAEELRRRGAQVTLVKGPGTLNTSANGIKLVNINTASEMFEACTSQDYDIVVMAAAVADYSPVGASATKIKKTKDEMHVRLTPTKDILKTLGERKTEKQVLVGFSLETDNEKENAKKKLAEKNADVIVLNSLRDQGAGFGHDTNKVTLFFKDGSEKESELKSKVALAEEIVDSITELLS